MRVFSGIRPTGELHIGNYLGAIKQWIALQEKHECVFCIVDLHGITTPYEPKELQKNITQIAIIYLAAGIDPQKSIIFVQSQVPEHTELNWLLSTITPVGELQRMTQFKEKSLSQKKNIIPHTKSFGVRVNPHTKFGVGVNAGLLNYPILMAADILLYNTDIVPVGKDQKQHVELAREIARRFNKKFGETFKIPEPLLPKSGAKIMSLIDPKKKMSKSDLPQSYISLFDNPEEIEKKIKNAQTDSGKEIQYEPKIKPGISNLLTIYGLFSNTLIKEIEKEFKNKDYKFFKERLVQLLVENLKPFRRKKKELELRQEFLENTLEQGKKKAEIIAQKTMNQVRRNMGLLA